MTEPHRPVRKAFLGLGSNLGNRRANLRMAVEALESHGLRAVSPVYETEPVGGPVQGPYLNLVAELETALEPRALLEVCQRLEAAAGRVRTERWGARTLDVDLLWIEDVTVSEPDLEVPHPRMWQRRFVLAPLRDIAPDLVSAEAVAGAEGEISLADPL